MGDADYLRLGDWNVRCDRCNRKMKGSEAKETWNGLKVCSPCWEPRQPQDYVRSIVEHPTPPFVRNPPDIFVPYANPIVLERDNTSLPFAIPDQDLEYILLEGNGWILSED